MPARNVLNGSQESQPKPGLTPEGLARVLVEKAKPLGLEKSVEKQLLTTLLIKLCRRKHLKLSKKKSQAIIDKAMASQCPG